MHKLQLSFVASLLQGKANEIFHMPGSSGHYKHAFHFVLFILTFLNLKEVEKDQLNDVKASFLVDILSGLQMFQKDHFATMFNPLTKIW